MSISKRQKPKTRRLAAKPQPLARAKRLTSGPRLAKSKRTARSEGSIKPDERLEAALRLLREGRSQKRAAEAGMVSVKRFRDFLRRNKLAKFQAGRWLITDRRLREITVISEGHSHLIKVRGFSPASLAMRHRAAV